MGDSGQLKPEDVQRAMLFDALQKLPSHVSQSMLGFSALLKILQLPSEDTVRIFGKRILRSHLLDTLIEVANGKTTQLFAHDGSVVSDTISLEPDGSAEIEKASNIARFSHVVLLGNDKAGRKKAIKAIFLDGRFDPKRERYWRRIANERALSPAEYVALEAELLNRSEAVHSEISNDLIGEAATIDLLAHALPSYLHDLIGLPDLPDTQDGFQEAWLDQVGKLTGKHLMRRLRLSAPMAFMGGNIVGKAAKGLQLKARWQLFDYLMSRPEPLSILGALEIACLSHPDSGALECATKALEVLWNPNRDVYEHGLVNLHTAHVAATALWAKDQKLQDWPLYAQRLARFMHAAHIARTLDQHNVEQAELQERVLGAFQYRARLAEYRDLQQDPFWQSMYAHPATLMAIVFRRTVELISTIPEDERPTIWTDLGAPMIEYLNERHGGLMLFAATPFSPLSGEWSGLQEIDAENVDSIFEALAGNDPALWFDRMLKLQIAFELPEPKRMKYRERVSEIIESLTGQEFIQATEINLHIAARWRDVDFSDDIINIVFRRFKAENIDSRSALGRQVFLASACERSQEEWLNRLRVLSTAFAQIYPERKRIDIYRDSLMAIGDMSEDLRRAVAPALSTASLVDDEVV